MASAVRGPPGTVAKGPPPNQTLYVNSLPSGHYTKDELKRNLYMLFATYGVVLDVVVMKTKKMRGQAHVVFRDVESSTQAMRALQGFKFFEHEMRIHYAKGKSDAVAKLDGTYKLPVPEQQVVETTDLQKAIFGGGAAPSKALPTQTAEDSARGSKRPREEEEEEEEEESDAGSAMDVSDSD